MWNDKNFALVVSDSQIILYFTSYKVEDAYLVIIGGEQFLLTDMRYYNSAIKNANATCLLAEEYPLKDFLKSKGAKKVGLIYEYTTASLYNQLLGEFEVCDFTSEVFYKLSKKTQSQIALIKNACEITERAYAKTLKHLKEGITERELCAILEYNFKLEGADGSAFDSIVAFGEGSAIPHYQTGDVKLKKDTPVLMDFGCSYNGFCSDMTRSFFYGNPTDEYKHVYGAVLRAQQVAYKTIRSGLTGVEADQIARNVLAEYGLDKYFTHGLGHGIGVKIHEGVALSKRGKQMLEDGNVFSIEPGVYIKDKFGVRIEDTVYLEKGKCVSLITQEKTMAIKPR